MVSCCFPEKPAKRGFNPLTLMGASHFRRFQNRMAEPPVWQVVGHLTPCHGLQTFWADHLGRKPKVRIFFGQSTGRRKDRALLDPQVFTKLAVEAKARARDNEKARMEAGMRNVGVGFADSRCIQRPQEPLGWTFLTA